MSHPFKALLDEYEIAIKKLPPTLPDVAEAAKKTLTAMREDDAISEGAVLKEIANLGRKEYAHRHALQDLHHKHGGEVSVQQVLDHADADVAAKVKPLLDSGATMAEIVQSDLFQEELTAAQRYQIEDGLLLAQYKQAESDESFVQANQAEFDKRVAHWENHAEEIDAKLRILESLASEDEQYKQEIFDQVAGFRVGWSVVERDPSMVEIDAAIDYWRDVLGMENEA